ncbi:hypothetical protein QTP88_009877 [Uroleucon formosanum]
MFADLISQTVRCRQLDLTTSEVTDEFQGVVAAGLPASRVFGSDFLAQRLMYIFYDE